MTGPRSDSQQISWQRRPLHKGRHLQMDALSLTPCNVRDRIHNWDLPRGVIVVLWLATWVHRQFQSVYCVKSIQHRSIYILHVHCPFHSKFISYTGIAMNTVANTIITFLLHPAIWHKTLLHASQPRAGTWHTHFNGLSLSPGCVLRLDLPVEFLLH